MAENVIVLDDSSSSDEDLPSYASLLYSSANVQKKRYLAPCVVNDQVCKRPKLSDHEKLVGTQKDIPISKQVKSSSVNDQQLSKKPKLPEPKGSTSTQTVSKQVKPCVVNHQVPEPQGSASTQVDLSPPKPVVGGKRSQRMQEIKVYIHRSLFDNQSIMKHLSPGLQEINVQFSVCDQTPTNSVRWKRKVLDTQTPEQQHEEPECCMVVTCTGTELLDYVRSHRSGQLQQNPIHNSINEMLLECKINPCLAVYNLEAVFRQQKNERNRKFRAAVRAGEGFSTSPGFVNKIECEEALVDLQTDLDVCIRKCRNEQRFSTMIVKMTKALADRPYRKKNNFSFYDDVGHTITRKALSESSNPTCLIWQHQLLQFSRISPEVASAITAVYPSPSHLLKAYDKCTNVKEGQNLLKDILVRRHSGACATTRRIGEAISKKVYVAFTSDEANSLIS